MNLHRTADRAIVDSNAQPAPDQLMVTASDLVRHFGVWQDRAARAPVYVLHRGRPRHVLTSVEIMDALCRPHQGQGGAPVDEGDAQRAILLDAIDDLIVITDRDDRICAASSAARIFFGGELNSGVALTAVVAPASVAMLNAAMQRTRATGIAESVDIAALRYPDRHLQCSILPLGGGLLIKLHDLTLADDIAALRAVAAAADASKAALDGVATAQINLRGYLEGEAPTLAAMTRLSAESMASVRFVSLFDIASRAMLGEAIERCLATGAAQALGATILVNHGAPAQVRLGIGVLRRGASVIGAVVTIVASHVDKATN